MKKNIILLVAMSLTLSGCGIYTKYKPATSVPDDLYGGEVVTEDTAGLGPSSRQGCEPIPTTSPPSFA